MGDTNDGIWTSLGKSLLSSKSRGDNYVLGSGWNDILQVRWVTQVKSLLAPRHWSPSIRVERWHTGNVPHQANSGLQVGIVSNILNVANFNSFWSFLLKGTSPPLLPTWRPLQASHEKQSKESDGKWLSPTASIFCWKPTLAEKQK